MRRRRPHNIKCQKKKKLKRSFVVFSCSASSYLLVLYLQQKDVSVGKHFVCLLHVSCCARNSLGPNVPTELDQSENLTKTRTRGNQKSQKHRT